MPEIEMPEGRYLSLSGMIRAGTGGQTRALLMRNRILTRYAGIPTTLTTFDSAPVYDGVRAALEEHGQLVPGMELLNIYEWFRNQKGTGAERLSEELPEPAGFVAHEELHPDGTVYRTTHRHKRSGVDAIHDYRRPDGSVYLRTPAGPNAESAPATPWVLTDASGAPTHSWARQNGWHRMWLRLLAGDAERVFVISDSRFELAHVIPMRDPRFHVMHLMHNTHTVGERRWNSNLSGDYGPLLRSIGRIDGLVTLTARQREDVIERYGATNNLFVVPNPVDLPELPAVMPSRERATFAVVSRLENQKRLDDAIRAFALVLDQEPEARLDIYGDGNLRVPLQALIEELGVGHRVVLRGHSPHARENLLSATGFLMTSRFEGYPLATLESMSHGCPVVSYDIKYGPREQITDGVDGFVTPPGDLQRFADRVVQMIRDPDLVTSMSRAARLKAEQHDYRNFLRDWRHVIETVVTNKPDRVRFEGVDLDVRRLSETPPGRFRGRFGARWAKPRASRRPPVLHLEAGLHLRGKARPRTLGAVVVSLDAVCDGTGAVARVPISVRADGRRFDVRARIDVADLFGRLLPSDNDLRLRLRVVWNNASWETNLSRPARGRAPFEVSFDRDGALSLSRSEAVGA
jgi:poly(glycerol-phosphate) alpha-glucosyltransferase